MKTFSFRIGSPLFERLEHHLFPGDGDEHGAVILAGLCETERGTRFLARDVLLAKDGVDYVPGRYGYRALTAEFVAQASNRCAREHLCYFAVHCHGGRDSVGFSDTDIESHERGYPALLDITTGGPVGALVFAQNAVAGEIWTPTATTHLDGLTVVGLNHRRLYPRPPRPPFGYAAEYHRQSLLFGVVGQQILRDAKVAIIGLGGVGSLINEWLSRLGVGEIVAIDFDQLEASNRPRVVGSRRSDSLDWLRSSRWQPMRRFGDKLAKNKVHIAERVARQANPAVRFHPVVGDLACASTAKLLRDCDYLFLCADTMQSRLVFNALVNQYLIPGVQIGSKVPVDLDSGAVGDVFSVARVVVPHSAGGCLLCNQLIPSDKLAEEALNPGERRRQGYVRDVPAPSVITLNAVGAAQAANDFLFGYLGLFDDQLVEPGYRIHYARSRQWRSIECAADDRCLHCGSAPGSAYARGDRAVLPCRGG